MTLWPVLATACLLEGGGYLIHVNCLLVQRIESTWPASLLTGMDAFILSLPTTASSTLPTSSRSSDSGIGGTTGVSQAISGYARLPAWFSRGWTRVPSNDGDEDLTARANSVVAATSQAAFPGQGRITGTHVDILWHVLEHLWDKAATWLVICDQTRLGWV